MDTTANDWNQLCRNITHADSYQSTSDGIYSHFMARSFYEQVAPAGSVALAYSGKRLVTLLMMQILSMRVWQECQLDTRHMYGKVLNDTFNFAEVAGVA